MGSSAVIRTGVYLAVITALVSGVSVYVNSFGVRRVPDPFVFTTAKNLVVGALLATALLAPFAWRQARSLSRGDLARLGLLGLVGGSIPFLLFFHGLQQATAPSAAFIHKTLFIWVAFLAWPLLGERAGRLQIAALALLVLGNLVLSGLPSRWGSGSAELFTLVATLLWAIEAVIARRFLRGGLPASVAALGRMGFGAVMMTGFLVVTGRAGGIMALDASQWGWVLLTSGFLLVYVAGYYGALKRAPATMVTSVLVLGSVVTSLLHAAFSARDYTALQAAGFAVVAGAVGMLVVSSIRTRVTARSRVAAGA